VRWIGPLYDDGLMRMTTMDCWMDVVDVLLSVAFNSCVSTDVYLNEAHETIQFHRLYKALGSWIECIQRSTDQFEWRVWHR
jgi:hypothetical protein